MTDRLSCFTVLLQSIFLFSGCSYKLGGPIPEKINLYLDVKNNSVAPQLGPKLARELRKQNLKNNTLEYVNNSNEADLNLLIEISDFNDVAESFDRHDSTLAKGFSFQASVLIRLIDTKGETVFYEEVNSKASLYRNKRNLRPNLHPTIQALAESLASEVSAAILKHYW